MIWVSLHDFKPVQSVGNCFGHTTSEELGEKTSHEMSGLLLGDR
jgi:hypothetical protein